jgi:VIT1/CCC1 family predicted Fe2+/Mn2+ transporter
MATTADTLPAPAAHTPTSIGEAASKRHWVDHAARTTAVLAVLAAVSSGQYANQFSRTILAQAEASDQWSYYQAKSIKRHVVEAQIALLTALALTRPEAAEQLRKLQDEDHAAVKRYMQELDTLKAQAENTERMKRLHEKQGNWFQGAFIILQAGVVLCTIASSAKRKELWALAIALGIAGLAVVGYGFLIGLRPPV